MVEVKTAGARRSRHSLNAENILQTWRLWFLEHNIYPEHNATIQYFSVTHWVSMRRVPALKLSRNRTLDRTSIFVNITILADLEVIIGH